MEKEENIKRLKLDNEERSLKLENERMDIEERRLVIIARKQDMGLIPGPDID
jgi:hypothetical protein